MTQFKPYIIVNRLVITKSGYPVYDEKYHAGVNIIRGKNSSGKSTIADFLFYALGGDITKWKEEAKSCDYTYIEVLLNGKIFTLKREINEKSKRGMDIFAGNLQTAQSSVIEGWLRYPYQATDNKESYYQALLKELSIPYSKSDNNYSITLHQLLRLMYVDQMTSLDRLFKFDRFDSPSKRKAIGELLIGLSDYDLYEYRVRAQKLDALLDLKIKEIRILHQFFGDEIKTIEDIDKEIAAKKNEIEGLEEELAKGNDENLSEDQELLSILRRDIAELRTRFRKLHEEKSSYAFDISDSQKFVQSLSSRIKAIEESSSVIHALSDIGFHYCPSCFNEIDHSKTGCRLCGSDLNGELTGKDPTFKIRKEIEFQISESNHLIGIRQEKLSKKEVEINQINTTLESKLRELASLERPSTEVSIHNRNIILSIGSKNREIKQLNDSKVRFAKLHDLYELRDSVQRELNNIRDQIARREASIETELTRKKNMLSALTIEILRADRDHEEVFLNGRRVDFDFGEDRVSIDDRVLFSASSMVYLKNAFRLALLQASCIDKSYLYPRFLIMDNVEDKGMEPQRSQLFQREIVKVSSTINIPHQIIFTTSMIDEGLDNPSYCIGDKYDDHNKSLKFTKAM
jgi:DNA repair exonuclease SbcCD ATPase subunit